MEEWRYCSEYPWRGSDDTDIHPQKSNLMPFRNFLDIPEKSGKVVFGKIRGKFENLGKVLKMRFFLSCLCGMINTCTDGIQRSIGVIYFKKMSSSG